MAEPGSGKEKPPCPAGEHELYAVDERPKGNEPGDPPLERVTLSGRRKNYLYCRKCDKFYWEDDESLSEEESLTGRGPAQEDENDDEEDED